MIYSVFFVVQVNDLVRTQHTDLWGRLTNVLELRKWYIDEGV